MCCVAYEFHCSPFSDCYEQLWRAYKAWNINKGLMQQVAAVALEKFACTRLL